MVGDINTLNWSTIITKKEIVFAFNIHLIGRLKVGELLTLIAALEFKGEVISVVVSNLGIDWVYSDESLLESVYQHTLELILANGDWFSDNLLTEVKVAGIDVLELIHKWLVPLVFILYLCLNILQGI